MSAFVPGQPGGVAFGPEPTSLHQRPLSPAERRARWEVRAAQWRARAIAERVFGRVGQTTLHGMRADGPMRGLLRMSVSIRALPDHHDREARFMAAVREDPVLSRIGLVYVLGPDDS